MRYSKRSVEYMATLLFASAEEQADFENLLAARKLENLRKEQAACEADIIEAINKCGEILQKHGIERNYYAELAEIDSELQKEAINNG